MLKCRQCNYFVPAGYCDFWLSPREKEDDVCNHFRPRKKSTCDIYGKACMTCSGCQEGEFEEKVEHEDADE